MFRFYKPHSVITLFARLYERYGWNWMKDWIQERYWQARYDAAKIPLPQLRRIIWDAWKAVPEEYIAVITTSALPLCL